MQELIQKNKQKIRFVIAGVGATVIDFASFSIGILFGLTNIPANFISTFIALCFSFFVNKNYTFGQSKKTNFRQVLTFVGVTLVGIWVLQPIVISLLQPYVSMVIHNYLFASIAAKCAATLVSLTWNYVLYSRVVFKGTPENSDQE